MIADTQKAQLFRTWMTSHLNVRSVLLFSRLLPEPAITLEAKTALLGCDSDIVHLYVLYIGDSANMLKPLYIGKADSPAKRWLQGHLPKLRRAATGSDQGSYGRWWHALQDADTEVRLFVIAEPDIQYPPIPGFPKTVGSIEYQLIALATDAFPGVLLNYEGVGR